VASEGPFAKINSAPHPKATFTDAGVASGKTYFYVTTAVNQKGHESKFSNQVRVTIPNS
jgi:fibronectin type 3 domain-containing protein